MPSGELINQSQELSLRDRIAKAVEQAEPTLPERLSTDPIAYLDLVRLTDSARAESSILLTAAVQSARGAGCTWSQIGEVLGITRQAAQQRYGSEAEATETSGSAQTMRLEGLTAFNEMSVLSRAGCFGWHSIDYGPYYHLVERDENQWEHARTFLGIRPDGEGWRRVGAGWAWWTYWARPVDAPALEMAYAPSNIFDDQFLR